MKTQYIVYVLFSNFSYPILKNGIKATEENLSLFVSYMEVVYIMNM